MSHYKVLLFDLGKVVFDVSFGRAFASWEETSKLPYETIRKRFKFDEAYDLFSEDKLTIEEYAQHVSTLIGFPLSVPEFEKGWCDIYLDVYPAMPKLLAKLKKNYRLVALTNTNASHAKVWPAKYAEVLSHFERIFSSHEIRARKPEKLAYTIVLDYLGIAPGEALFLDDTAPNVVGAADAGIKGIIVTSSSQLEEALKNEGIVF